jgi:hypothetical protein
MNTKGEWRYTSIILDLGTRWRRLVSFTPGPLYPQSRSCTLWKREKLLAPARNRSLTVHPVTHRYTDWDILAPWVTERVVTWNTSEIRNKQEVLGLTNRLLSFIRLGPHWKRRVQQFFCCCVCIRHRGNVTTQLLPGNDGWIFTEPLPSKNWGIFTEPLPSNDKGIHVQTHRLMGGIF